MSEDNDIDRRERLGLTRDIVTAYVAGNAVDADSLPSLITSVFETLERLASGVDDNVNTQSPAVPIDQSVTDDAILCL